jgi:hypothetical protein
MMKSLIVALGVLLVGFTQARNIQPEIFIPVGMPISLNVSLDENQRGITKYNIKRIVGQDVDKVTMRVVTVGPDNKLDEESGYVATLMTARVSDLASVEWKSSEDVRRLIVIVERVETTIGVWVVDSEDQQTNLKAIVERGQDGLPTAKFIKKQ